MCYALNNGFTFESIYNSLLNSSCGADSFEKYVKDRVEDEVKPTLCRLSKALDSALKVPLRRVLGVVLILRGVADSLDGLLSDVEDFNVAGIRVPRALTRPLRRLVDNLLQLVEDIDSGIDEVFSELEVLKGYCDGGEN